MEKRMNLKNILLLGSLLGAAACADVDVPDVPMSEPEISENSDLRVAAAPGETALVSVRSRSFNEMADLYNFAIDEMGGKPVYDDLGAIIGVRGVSVAAGSVRYLDQDTGEEFDASDLAQAYLGGAAGTIEVAGKTLQVNAPESTLGNTSAALTDDSSGCVGDDCITGHSWRNDYIAYKSVGSETKQSSGGYGTYRYLCCRPGTLVTYQGRRQCKVVTEWEPPNYEEGETKPTPAGYEYVPAQTCTASTTQNSLTLSVTPIDPFGWPGATVTRTENNTREIRVSNWAIGVGIDFLGISDVQGVCGYHAGSRGTETRTRAGSATDAQCGGASGGDLFWRTVSP